MRSFDALAGKLACPQCKASLQTERTKIICSKCAIDFPIWAGIPWVFADAEHRQADWSQRLHFYLQNLQQDIDDLKLELRLPELLPKTEVRLKHLIQAKSEQHREMSKLFQALELGPAARYEQHLASGTPLPEAQHLMGYYGNILRDWGFGEQENRTVAKLLSGILNSESKLGQFLVLGSGPSRLAYDLHRELGAEQTIAVDINPLYLLVAERMLAGKTMQLYEFPFAPLEAKAFASRVKCQAPESLKDNFYLLMADAMNPCFQNAAFDTLLTPWLIDIVDQDFRSFARKLNRVLKLGGRWLNFGSTVFHQRLQSLCYSREEILEILTLSGFELLKVETPKIPYLHSPHSCQERHETVFCFLVRKIAEIDAGPDFHPSAAWLRDPHLVVPQEPDVQQQMLVHLTLAQVMAQIDGQKSLWQIAEVMAPQFGLSLEQTLPMLERILARFMEGRGRRQSF